MQDLVFEKTRNGAKASPRKQIANEERAILAATSQGGTKRAATIIANRHAVYSEPQSVLFA